MKWQNKSLSYWLRVLHRDLGYLMVGACLIYAVSGILLNHMNGKDPAFRTTEAAVQLEKGMQAEELLAAWNRQEDLPPVKRVLSIDESHHRLMLEGGVGVYDAASGCVDKEVQQKIKKNIILNNISLYLTGGNVYGFVGRNGSGKTMLFRALSGLIKIDEGKIYYNGENIFSKYSVLPDIGMIIENTGMYLEYSGFKNLDILAGINKKIGKKEIIESLERVGLDPSDKRAVRKYSLGMKQRLAIAQAIMEKPKVIMLDEPTNGLDQEGVNLIRKVIAEEKHRGAIILLASHNSEDIRVLSDKIYRMDMGKISLERENG